MKPWSRPRRPATRRFHRLTKQFRDVEAESAQEACARVGWKIGHVWVRVKAFGQCTHGWSDVTKREAEHENDESPLENE
jgi:hypothetical protein